MSLFKQVGSWMNRKDEPNRNVLVGMLGTGGMFVVLIVVVVAFVNHPYMQEAMRKPPPNKTWALIEFDSPILSLPEGATVLRVRYGNEIEPVSGGLPYPPNPPMSKLPPNPPAPPTTPPQPAPPTTPPRGTSSPDEGYPNVPPEG